MKVYFPINIDFYEAETSKVYGWKDETSSDIFICSNSKPKLIPEFKTIEIESCIELGYLSCNPSFSQSNSYKPIQLSINSDYFVCLNADILPESEASLALIYYQIELSLSDSADFSKSFSKFPLKQIKWASILNFNPDGHFLRLTRVQRLLSCAVSSISSLNFVKFIYLSFERNISSIELFKNSSFIDQMFRRYKQFDDMYKFILLNESVLSDWNRIKYRNNLILSTTDVLLSLICLDPLMIFVLPRIRDHFFTPFTIRFFEEFLDWFMGWPAGFKFNANLTKFLGKFFLSLLAIWKIFALPNFDGYISTMLSINRNFGLTFVLGIISDFWSVSTLHIWFFYQVMLKIYQLYWTAIVSLFRMFRGKKWNVLRKRVDSSNYTMDQLLVGMLLFSILFCTFPTVIAYYLLFAFSYIFCLIIKLSLESCRLLLNSFPIYPILLKVVKSPIATTRFRLQPFDLKLRTPSFLLSLESSTTAETFNNLWAEVIKMWSALFSFRTVSNLIHGLSILEQ